MEKNILLLLKQFHENVRSKTSRCKTLSHSSEMKNDTLMHREGLIGWTVIGILPKSVLIFRIICECFTTFYRRNDFSFMPFIRFLPRNYFIVVFCPFRCCNIVLGILLLTFLFNQMYEEICSPYLFWLFINTHHYIIFFVRSLHYKPGMESYCWCSTNQLSL